MAVRTILERLRIHEQTGMLLLALLVGLLGGLGAVFFRHLISAIQWLFYGTRLALLETVPLLPWWRVVAAPMLGAALIGPLVYWGAREARGHGVPEVMEAVALRGGVIRRRVAIVKILASALCIGSGGSVGREGPIVQIGSSIGSACGQWIHASSERMRTLVGCGAAAGIAATFNAPIAGVLFSLEVILADLAVATFSPIVVASVAATAVSRILLGDTPAFMVPKYQLTTIWEIPLAGVLGILAGVTAVTFTTALYKTEDLFEKIPCPEYVRPVLGGIALGTMALAAPQILGVGYETIDRALLGDLSWQICFLLIWVKILASALTIGSGGSGGIFAPSLFIGAVVGGFFGHLVHELWPHATALPGAYSLVGMGSVVAGTTHASITAILILFELTGDYKIILPMMLACIVSTVVARRFQRASIYTLKLIRRGVDLSAGKELNVLKSLRVADSMSRRVETVPEAATFRDLKQKLLESPYQNYPVVNGSGEVTGILSFQDIRAHILDDTLEDLVRIRDVSRPPTASLTPADNLHTAMTLMNRHNLEMLPVVSEPGSRRLIGVLSRSDILRDYNHAILKETARKSPDAPKAG